jgi:hypothetical protein
VNQKYGLHFTKQFCGYLKIQVAAHSIKGVKVQKSMMQQKEGRKANSPIQQPIHGYRILGP